MYFITQIKSQFLRNLVNYQDTLSESTAWNGPTQPAESTPSPTDIQNPALSPEMQERINSLQAELDGLKLERRFLVPQITKIWNFLEQVEAGKFPDLSPDDIEFKEMLGKHEKKIESLKILATEWKDIEMLINQALSELSKDIQKETVGMNWNSEWVNTFVTANENAEVKSFSSENTLWDVTERVFTTEDIPVLEEKLNTEKMQFRKVFFEDILKEPDTGKPLSEYKNNEVVTAFEWVLEDGNQFSYSLSAIIDAYENISIEEWVEIQTQWEDLTSAIAWYERLNRNIDIVSRDIAKLDSWKTLWEARLEITHEGFRNLMLDAEGKLTKEWELIASWDESLTPAERIPKFEDLKMDQIKVLRDNWVNLKKLFLVQENGSDVNSSILEQGESYIVNFSANQELPNSMDFSFIDTSAKDISIDGIPVTFQQDGPLWAWYYDINNEQIFIQDGSKVTIWEKRTDSSAQVDEAIEWAVRERLDNFAMTSTQERMVTQAIMSWNPSGTFDTSTFPKWILWTILAVLSNWFNGTNYTMNEDGTWSENKEWNSGWMVWENGEALTNQGVIESYRWNMELGSLSARFESSSQWSKAYNPNDNGHGPSYGTYQMNSTVWVYKTFIRKHGIAEWKQAWMAAIQKFGPEEFKKMEHDHIKQNNYDPMIWRITVPNKEKFSMAMQNVIWSIGVQHGPWHKGLLGIINKSWVIAGDKNSEAQLINALYNKREKIWPAWIASRYRPERTDALAMLNTLSASEHPNVYEQGLQDVALGTKSVDVPDWYTTPQCSMVARQNLQKFWVDSVNRWASARASFEMYPTDKITAFPPAAWSTAKVADFFLEASEKNAQYGHRVAAYQTWGQWFVCDPYYGDNINSVARRTEAIPAEKYIQYMESKGRKFWWAAYFS